MNEPPTVILVDDDPSVLRAHSRALRAAGYRVESFASPSQFLQRPILQGPGCLLVDLAMPAMSGLQLQETIASSQAHLPVIFISGRGDVPSVAKAMKSGAVDFFEKPVPLQLLLDAVAASIARHRAVLQDRGETGAVSLRFQSLTPREKEVAVRVTRGLMNKEIAAQLGAAEKTVKIHRARAMRKLQASSIAQLVRLLDRIGLK